MMQRRRLRLSDGTYRDLIPGEILPEGASIIVPLMLKDELKDEDTTTREAREVYEILRHDLGNAWQGSVTPPTPVPAPAPVPNDPREAMKLAISSAWRAA